MDALSTVSTRRTSQREQADPRQIVNSAGGYAFAVDADARLHRFLTLGTEGGTYYVTERNLTKQNADVVLDWARNRAGALVAVIVEVSVAGRAPRQNPAIFALAAAAALGDDNGRRAALDALPQVCRTGTHLFLFAGYVEQFRGWGRGLRRAVANWYTAKDVDSLAYQMVKYRQREGWSHRDLLRLAHPDTAEAARKGLFDWACGRDNREVPAVVDAFQNAQHATTVAGWLDCIRVASLSWEMLPDAALRERDVWAALIDKGMPQTALMRQLPRLTTLGVLDSTEYAAKVAAQLTDGDRIRKARLHPINVLVAQRTYASGVSARGSGTWTPNRRIVDALDAAFYLAFGAVEPTGKRTLLALDVSGSMGWTSSGLPISCREATGALSLVTAAVEPDYQIVGFCHQLTPLAISPRQRLDDVLRTISDLPFGGTDCSLPMLWAEANRAEFDTFIVYTDNETRAGAVHPHQALEQYRQRSGIDARLAVVGMAATDFTIADPADPGSLDIAGFDSAVPQLIGDFSAGSI